MQRYYGGRTTDWVKKSSSTYCGRDGMCRVIHWHENIRMGQRVEFKPKMYWR
jgi:hypothetical protein